MGVIEGSRADVSFIAGLLVDKLVYHLPLYRQHQRLAQCGIRVSRQWLTQIAQAAIALIEPVHDAQWQSVLVSRVKRMDETPLKAGREGPGKMKSAYFWPVMGEHEEICFHYQPSRRQEHVEQLLGPVAVAGSVLHTDGYKCVCLVCEEDRHRPCSVLGAQQTRVREGRGNRTGTGGPGSGAHRRVVPRRR
jgi:transposase